MTARVLVTGASGFVGRSVLPSLYARGFEVHGTARTAVGEDFTGNCVWHRADLLDRGQRRKLLEDVAPTHLLHLAWYAVPGKYWTAPENAAWVDASLDLIAAARGLRVVMTGTCAEYDWSASGTCRETDVGAPSTPYGIAKAAVQRALAQSGVDSAWARIFFPFGPHEAPERLVPSVVRALLRGVPAYCTHGAQVRDFLYVEDLADALVALLSHPIQGPINIASGEERTIRSLIESVQGSLGGTVLFGALPAPTHEPPRLLADITRLRDELRWSPPLGIATGLRRTIDWWRRTAQHP